MKKYGVIVPLILIMLCSACPAGAAAKAFTQNEFTTAESFDTGMSQTGIQFTIGNSYENYYPSFRYGVRSLLEIGAKIGITTAHIGSEDKIGALIGADVKFQLIKETEGVPVDMAIDVGFDSVLIGGEGANELTFSTIFSKSFPLTQAGYKLTPYGGIELAAEYGSYQPDRNTNLLVFGGVEWRISQKFMVLLELKTGDYTLGGASIKFEY